MTASYLDLKGFWRWCMLYRPIWLLLDSVHCLVYGSFTKDHNVSETGSVSILRWMGQGLDWVIETSSFWRAQLNSTTLPHPPEDGDRSSLRNIVVFCKTSTYQTMDRVQKKPNSSVHHIYLVLASGNSAAIPNQVQSKWIMKPVMKN
jgi:hypothetical protein